MVKIFLLNQAILMILFIFSEQLSQLVDDLTIIAKRALPLNLFWRIFEPPKFIIKCIILSLQVLKLFLELPLS